MIYGEGGREAFVRLQKAIMEQSDDQTLFAWKQEDGVQGHGLLATSASAFTESSSFIPTKSGKQAHAYRMTNRGLEIQLRLTCTLRGGDHLALLRCNDSTIGIYLSLMEDGRFIRTRISQLAQIQHPLTHGYKPPTSEIIYVPQLYVRQLASQRKFHFHVVEADSMDFAKRDSVKILGRALWSTIANKTPRGYFALAETTSPSRRFGNNTLDFTLGVGGRVGLRYDFPLNTYTFKKLRFYFLAVIFGVNQDGSVFADITQGVQQFASRNDYSRDYFDKHILQSEVDSSSKSATGDVKGSWRHQKLHVELVPKLVDGELIYDVRIS